MNVEMCLSHNNVVPAYIFGLFLKYPISRLLVMEIVMEI